MSKEIKITPIDTWHSAFKADAPWGSTYGNTEEEARANSMEMKNRV